MDVIPAAGGCRVVVEKEQNFFNFMPHMLKNCSVCEQCNKLKHLRRYQHGKKKKTKGDVTDVCWWVQSVNRQIDKSIIYQQI